MNLCLDLTTSSCSLPCSSTALIAARPSADGADSLLTTCCCDIDFLQELHHHHTAVWHQPVASQSPGIKIDLHQVSKSSLSSSVILCMKRQINKYMLPCLPPPPSPPSKAHFLRGQLVKGSQARRSTVCSGISGFLTLMEVWLCVWRKRFPITAKRRHLHPAHGCRKHSDSSHVSWRTAPACTAFCCLNYPEWSHYLWQREAQQSSVPTNRWEWRRLLLLLQLWPLMMGLEEGGTTGSTKASRQHWAASSKSSDERLIIKCGGKFRSEALWKPANDHLEAPHFKCITWLHIHSDPELLNCWIQ